MTHSPACTAAPGVCICNQSCIHTTTSSSVGVIMTMAHDASEPCTTSPDNIMEMFSNMESESKMWRDNYHRERSLRRSISWAAVVLGIEAVTVSVIASLYVGGML